MWAVGGVLFSFGSGRLILNFWVLCLSVLLKYGIFFSSKWFNKGFMNSKPLLSFHRIRPGDSAFIYPQCHSSGVCSRHAVPPGSGGSRRTKCRPFCLYDPLCVLGFLLFLLWQAASSSRHHGELPAGTELLPGYKYLRPRPTSTQHRGRSLHVNRPAHQLRWVLPV